MVALTIWQINLVVWGPFITPGLIYRLLEAQKTGSCVELPHSHKKLYRSCRSQAKKKNPRQEGHRIVEIMTVQVPVRLLWWP